MPKLTRKELNGQPPLASQPSVSSELRIPSIGSEAGDDFSDDFERGVSQGMASYAANLKRNIYQCSACGTSFSQIQPLKHHLWHKHQIKI